MSRAGLHRRSRSAFRIGCLVLTLALACTPGRAVGAASPATSGFPQVVAQAGTTVPQVNVAFGMRPVANDCIYVIGMKQGWYKDVGITITPAPYGNKSTFDDAVPLLVNNQLDVEGLDPIPTISTLKSVHNIRFIALSDLFLGFQILAAPSTHNKTVRDFIKQGLSFKAALRKTLAQMEGQTFTIPPIISNRGFLNLAFDTAGLNLFKDTHVLVTPDSTALNLASGGKVKYASFDGAPFTAQLLGAGWIPLVTPLDLAQGLPGGPTSPAELLVEPPGLASPQNFAQQHPDTILRFVSVMFRIIQAINANPKAQLAYELPFINAFAGTSLTLPQLQNNILNLDPLISFDEQGPYFDSPSSSLYYKNWFQATLKFNIDKRIVPAGTYNPDDLIWAGTIYHELVDFRHKSDALFAKAAQESLSADKSSLVTRAREFYKDFDYLDSYRLLLAATA
jgi:ABC-type nitrate/sulfonate/bicarbonate transport system substrate-binding protein